MKFVLAILFAATFGVHPLPQEDGPLEPSIQNEVDHAVSLGERWLGRFPASAFTNAPALKMDAQARALAATTNGLSREKIALTLISSQRGEGWWTTPTNVAPTRLAVEILKGL